MHPLSEIDRMKNMKAACNTISYSLKDSLESRKIYTRTEQVYYLIS